LYKYHSKNYNNGINMKGPTSDPIIIVWHPIHVMTSIRIENGTSNEGKMQCIKIKNQNQNWWFCKNTIQYKTERRKKSFVSTVSVQAFRSAYSVLHQKSLAIHKLHRQQHALQIKTPQTVKQIWANGKEKLKKKVTRTQHKRLGHNACRKKKKMKRICSETSQKQKKNENYKWHTCRHTSTHTHTQKKLTSVSYRVGKKNAYIFS